jgi:predicted ATP-dependent Lon-type protease
LIELGPKGTGKPLLFSELSPYGMLILWHQPLMNNNHYRKTKNTDRGLVDKENYIQL